MITSLERRGQLKVQEMAFVLIALMVFFALAAILYITIRGSLLEQSARDQSDEQALEAVRQIASTPEFTWSECKGCIDLDKVFLLKQQIARDASLQGLWDYDYIAVESVYPARVGGECTPATYPACNRTTVLLSQESYGVAASAFVTICRWDAQEQTVCDLGKLYLSDKGRERASS